MIESKRKKEESFEGFLRRFNKRIQQSGMLMEARQSQHHKPSKSRNLRRRSALISNEMKLKFEYLRKVGKLKEESRNRW